MKFGVWSLEEAEGMLVAHSHVTPYGKLKKGHVLDRGDIGVLRELGLSRIVAARPEPGDLDEHAVARTLAAAVAGMGLELRDTHTGRANLHALHDGVLRVDAAAVLRINLVAEDVTLATLADHAPVRAGQTVATVKVVSLAVPERRVREIRAEAGQAARGVLAVHPYVRGRVGFVQTRLGGTRDTVLDKTVATLAGRLDALGGGLGLVGESRCMHDPLDLARAIEALRSRVECDLLVISTASATVDADDVLPMAIRRAGGRVERVGMPVDPGNLTVLGHVGPVPVLGMPGCARSPKRNGFDALLPRLAAGLPLSSADIAALGVGGLLNEPAMRARPRDVNPLLGKRTCTAVILAAGLSRRMGRENKLLLPLEGEPLLRRMVRSALDSVCRKVMVVIGHEAEAVRHALHGLDVEFVLNPDYREGLGASVRHAALAVPDDAPVIMCLGDMPRVGAGVLDKLIAAYDPDAGVLACQAAFEGKRGNPVLFGPELLPELRCLRGDEGARSLLGRHADAVVQVEVGDPGVLFDIDTPLDLPEPNLSELNRASAADFKR